MYIRIIYIYIYTHTHTHTHIHIHTYIYTYIHTYPLSQEITLAPDPHDAPIKKAETPHAQRSGPPPSTDKNGGHDTPAAGVVN